MTFQTLGGKSENVVVSRWMLGKRKLPAARRDAAERFLPHVPEAYLREARGPKPPG